MYSLYPSSVATIFITPPPVDTKLWPDRNSDVTAQYGEVVKDLAKELGCGVVDSQKAFEGQSLTALLRDGLHLSAAGYEVSVPLLIFSQQNVPVRSSICLIRRDHLSMRSAGYLSSSDRSRGGEIPRAAAG